MKRYLAPVGWALGMLVLILDGKTALSGAARGVELCIGTLIPSLFPFFVLSAMLTSSLAGGGLMLTGILGGYPVGAGNTAAAYRTGRLSAQDAARLVVLSNCAGPSFLFGIVAPVLENPWDGFLLWGVYLFSVFLLWTLLPVKRSAAGGHRPVPLQLALSDSVRAMAGVCGWVILMRVVISILDRWVLWLLPAWGQTAVYGLLELSNGCLSLTAIPPDTRLVAAAGMISFGGLCVILQTASVADGISLGLYFPGKVFQAAVSMLIASFLSPGVISPVVRGVFAVTALVSGAIVRKIEKRCGNPRPVGV